MRLGPHRERHRSLTVHMHCNTCCSPFETGNVPGVPTLSRINNQYQPIRLATANGL